MAKKKRRKRKIRWFNIFLVLGIIAGIFIAWRVTSPLIELLGSKDMTIEVYSEYTDKGARNILTGNHIPATGTVDTTKLGKYTIEYKFLGQKKTRTVRVVDTTKPTIKLIGGEEIMFNVNEFEDPGYIVQDNYDADIKDRVVVNSNVNSVLEGTYMIIYNVKDSSGNEADSVTRKVVISRDNYRYENTVTNKAKADEDLVNMLVNFTNNYYRNMKYLEFRDPGSFFVDEDSAKAYEYRMALKTLIDVRKENDLDYRMTDCRYDLEISSVKASGTNRVVTVKQNDMFQYKHLSRPSYQQGVEATFTVRKVDDEWKIVSLTREESFYLYFDKQLSPMPEEYRTRINEIAGTMKAEARLVNDKRQQFLAEANTGEVTITKTARNYDYDREKAAEYALEYALKKSEKPYINLSSNCMNFVSQCLHAGGIPMDTSGSGHTQQWKFYGNTVKTEQGTGGYVYSWTAIAYFNNYLNKNTTGGPVVEIIDNIYAAQKGDIIYMGNGSNGSWAHVMLVTDIIRDANDQIVDLVLCGSTNNQKEIPLSSISYTKVAAGIVVGYN